MNHDLEWAGWFGGLLIMTLTILLVSVWGWLHYQYAGTLQASHLQGLLKSLTFVLISTCLLILVTAPVGSQAVWLCTLILPAITAALTFSPLSPCHAPKGVAAPAWFVVTMMTMLSLLPLAAHLTARHIVERHHAGESWHLWHRIDGATWLVKEAWYDPHQILFIGAIDVNRVGYPEMAIGRAELISSRCATLGAVPTLMLSPSSPRTFGGGAPLPMHSGCLADDWIEIPATRSAMLAAADLLLKDGVTVTWEGLVAQGDDNAKARDFFEHTGGQRAYR